LEACTSRNAFLVVVEQHDAHRIGFATSNRLGDDQRPLEPCLSRPTAREGVVYNTLLAAGGLILFGSDFPLPLASLSAQVFS
jgi:hypothetical protein